MSWLAVSWVLGMQRPLLPYLASAWIPRRTSMLVHFSLLSCLNSFISTRCAMSAMLPSLSEVLDQVSSRRAGTGRNGRLYGETGEGGRRVGVSEGCSGKTSTLI
jgi:hypothetical protein